MRNLTAGELEAKWAKLKPSNYRVTSHATPRYNCLAFANDDEKRWWESSPYGGTIYWPSNVRREDSLATWSTIFESQATQLVQVGRRKLENRKWHYIDLDDL